MKGLNFLYVISREGYVEYFRNSCLLMSIEALILKYFVDRSSVCVDHLQ